MLKSTKSLLLKRTVMLPLCFLNDCSGCMHLVDDPNVTKEEDDCHSGRSSDSSVPPQLTTSNDNETKFNESAGRTIVFCWTPNIKVGNSFAKITKISL